VTPQQRAARSRDRETLIIDAAWAICQRARHCEATDTLAGDLTAAIAVYDLIHGHTIHAAAFWPDLAPVTPAQAYDTGLRRAATDILKALGHVLEQAPWLIGDDT
jgi:hypothetical protein